MASRDSWIDPEEVSELVGEIFPSSDKGEPTGDAAEDYQPVPLLDDDDGDFEAVSEAVVESCDDEQGTAERIAEIMSTRVEPPLDEIGGALLKVSVWEGPDNRVDLNL